MTTAPLTERWQSALMPTYAPPSIALVRGEGVRVWDDEGREYVDMTGGIAVSALGHAHPAVVDAVSAQIRTLAHASNLYASRPAVELAERLLALLGRDGRVFLCNSGAEANEAAFKLARRTGRPEVVAAHGAFHGRTMGALSLTGQPAKREPFEPLVPGVPGADRFLGPSFHSARWDHSAELADKRVAVVGTGASAIQIVPNIRREAAQVHVFQRTTPWVLPHPGRPTEDVERRLFMRVLSSSA